MADDEVPRNPFEGVTDYFSELNRMRQVGLHGREPGHESVQRTHASAWVPTADIYARENDLVIEIELPGVKPEDVSLNFAHGVLTVSGNRRPRVEDTTGDSYYVRERFYGAFRRAVTLPEGTDKSQIGALFDEGLVEITVRDAANRPDPDRIELRQKSGQPTRRTLG